MRFAKRSSTRAAVLIAAVGAAAVVAVVGLALGNARLAFGGLGAATIAAAMLALHLIVSERRRHEVAEEELSAQATFLESLVESMARIAETLDADEILERTCREAERLFDADATMLKPGEKPKKPSAANAIVAPLRVRDEEVAALRLVRKRPFARGDVVRATVLADFAARASENARLLGEATVREAERAQLSEQLITAEQDERRRLALFLHDGPVQSMSGIGLMLDAVIDSVRDQRLDDATHVLDAALERHRDTIRSLRDLSFNLEPVVLRDQGFGPAVRALADQVGLANQIQIEVDVDAAEQLAERRRSACTRSSARRSPKRFGAARRRESRSASSRTTTARSRPRSPTTARANGGGARSRRSRSARGRSAAG